MKRLSDSLEALATRVKGLEDSAQASFEADRAGLEKRRDEINANLTAAGQDLTVAIDEATAAGRSWWDEVRSSMKRPFEELHARYEKRRGEHELHKALRAADAAEADAVAAIEVASYSLTLAEYAVVDATLARMAADDLAAAQPATAETTTGVTF